MYAKKSFEKTTCVTKIIYHIFMQKCSKICKNLFHNAKRTKVCTFHDLNISTSLSHKIKHPVQKKHILKQVHVPSIEKISTFCVVMWMNTNLVCKMFVTCFFSQRLWYGISAMETSCRNYPTKEKETLDFLPFALNGNDYLATTDVQKLSVYKWMNV